MRCLHLRMSLIGVTEDERSLILIIFLTIQRLEIMLREIVLFAFID